MTEKSPQDNSQPSSNGRRTLLDFGPLLLFFGANYLYQDLMFSVKILVVATVISLGLSWAYERRIPMMAAFGCGALVFFGGASHMTSVLDTEVSDVPCRAIPVRMPKWPCRKKCAVPCQESLTPHREMENWLGFEDVGGST